MTRCRWRRSDRWSLESCQLTGWPHCCSVNARAGKFRRYFLPGFAFKAVIIGGGYATGRELAEFFLPSGPWGGLLGIIVAAAVCSSVCILTFVLARRSMSFDYRSFFRQLLGRFWLLFEILYVLQMIIGLAVFGSAAGAIGHALFGWPDLAGTLALVCLIAGFLAFGNPSVEQLFKYVSVLLYAIYGIFLVLGLTNFGERTVSAFAAFRPGSAWAVAGLTYAGYNLIGAIGALPTVRHMTSDLDAVKAGILVGPLAMVPAALFFVCMAAWAEVR